MSSEQGAGYRVGLVVFSVVLLAGCTSGGADTRDRRSTPGSATSSTPSPSTARAPLAFVGPSSPLLQDLWRPVGSLPPLRTSLPRRLNVSALQQSPRLDDGPIDSAVLAVGTQPQSYSVGEVAVMGAGGEWRIVDREVLGMMNPNIVEQQFELSPDGRTLALGDEFGVVFVDLATGKATRVSIRVKDPVLHTWTAKGRSVLVTRRLGKGRGNPAWDVRMADRTVSRVPFDPWNSSASDDGRVAELVPAATEPRSKRSYTDIRLWKAGRLLRTEPLQVGVPQEASVASQWFSLVGIRQASSSKTNAAGGVGALDPTTGRMAGFLQLPRKQLTWVSVQDVIGDWLLLNVSFGEGGGIVAWDPLSRRLHGVTEIDEQAAQVSLAGLQLPD